MALVQCNSTFLLASDCPVPVISTTTDLGNNLYFALAARGWLSYRQIFWRVRKLAATLFN